MCELVSWVEMPGGHVLYLTPAMIADTPRGEALRKGGCAPEDYPGHGAIRSYFDIPHEVGVDREVTDFSSPANFPPDVVIDIKAGRFSPWGNSAIGALLASAALEAVVADAECRATYAKWKAADAKLQAATDAKFRATDVECRATHARWLAAYTRLIWSAFSDPANRAQAWK